MDSEASASFSELLAVYTKEAAKVTKFLSLAESFGCKLLSSNTSRLAATLNELRRIKQRDVFPAASAIPRVSKFAAEDKKFDEATAATLNGLLPMMKDEEALADNWETVQSSLESVLPTVKANLDSWTNVLLPEMEKSLSAEGKDKLAAAIRATQALFIKEEDDRKAAEAAALLKTRAGKKAAALEAEKRREEAARKAAAAGGDGKKKKTAGEVEEDTGKLSVKARREARDAVKAARVRSANNTPATIAGEAALHHDVEALHL